MPPPHSAPLSEANPAHARPSDADEDVGTVMVLSQRPHARLARPNGPEKRVVLLGPRVSQEPSTPPSARPSGNETERSPRKSRKARSACPPLRVLPRHPRCIQLKMALHLIRPMSFLSALHPSFGGTLRNETLGVSASRRLGVPASISCYQAASFFSAISRAVGATQRARETGSRSGTTSSQESPTPPSAGPSGMNARRLGVSASRRLGVPASRRPGVDKLLPGRKFQVSRAPRLSGSPCVQAAPALAVTPFDTCDACALRRLRLSRLNWCAEKGPADPPAVGAPSQLARAPGNRSVLVACLKCSYRRRRAAYPEVLIALQGRRTRAGPAHLRCAGRSGRSSGDAGQ
jgi:hypothetical protein